ncbi:MAG: sulfur oxidation c-type cytochrome SoxX [Gammaproteobacteria bacterium]|nr:sulfur oxidation c-type cytochrome SoxX [Gammaproteobacteria bacterium]MCP5299308.1 sulfur oxidation c-type cytochrome SoxX [Chromatiaceae bacterium]
MRPWWIDSILCAALSSIAPSGGAAPGGDGYCAWEVQDFAIDQPLCGLRGDPARGRALAADSHGGNCLACHQMPIDEEAFHGTVGPPLHGIGARYSEGQIRLRIVDEQQINPMTIMPGFYSDPAKANRMAGEYWGKTFLTAQQVEDLVTYLVSLK